MSDLPARMRKWFETSSTKKKFVTGLAVMSTLVTGLLMATGPTAAAEREAFSATPLLLFGVLAKLSGVLLLIVGCAVVFRRWQRPNARGGMGRQMRVIESVRLSPRQALHLVAVGDQRLLIGATDQAVSLISVVESSAEWAQAAEQPAQTEVDFGMLLQSFNANLSAPDFKGKL